MALLSLFFAFGPCGVESGEWKRKGFANFFLDVAVVRVRSLIGKFRLGNSNHRVLMVFEDVFVEG